MRYVDEATVLAGAASQWQSSPALRNEFNGDRAAFEAFELANARGAVKIMAPVPGLQAWTSQTAQPLAAAATAAVDASSSTAAPGGRRFSTPERRAEALRAQVHRSRQFLSGSAADEAERRAIKEFNESNK